MTLRYLVDTTVLSEPLRPLPNKGILRSLEKHQAEIATATPVWHELAFGAHRLPSSPKRRVIERYLYEVIRPNLLILPYDVAAAEWHAAERARLSRMGKTPPFVDGQIASIAKVNALVLITANVKDFLPFKGIEVKDWKL